LSEEALLEVLQKVLNGNFTVRLPSDQTGMKRSICESLNGIFDLNERLTKELVRVGKSVGMHGLLNQRILLDGGYGMWSTCAERINGLISDLSRPTVEIAHVITSVAKGNLDQEIPLNIDGVPLRGEFLRIAKE